MTEMGKKRFPQTTRRLKVFLCRLSRRRWREKATTLTFFHDFLVKPPKRKVAAAAAFLQDHSEERERKRYEEDVKNVNTQNTRRVKSRF